MYYLRKLLLFFLCGFSSITYSQLANFNLNVVATAETCTNNGKLEMSVSNTTVGAEIIFTLYLAPEYGINVAVTNQPFFLTRKAGSYRVVATQTKDGQSNTQQKDVVIDDLVEPLDFDMTDTASTDCELTATLTVNVISGNPTQYEIISGPVTRPLQSSNQFSNLLSGTYIVRVFDDCNDALSKSYTFIIGNNDFSIGAPTLPEVFTSCNTIDITHNITSNTAAPILYPLAINYTVYAPDGSVSQSIAQTIATGPPDVLALTQNINLFGTDTFAVKVQVSDNCNNLFEKEFQVNPTPKLTVAQQNAECGELFFNLSLRHFLPPYNLTFTEPASFNPSLFNTSYPGPFNSSSTTFGSIDNTVPFGTYKVQVQDACGRTADLEFLLEDKPVEPVVTARNNGCDSSSGTINIQMPGNRTIVAISIIEAPTTYGGVLPENVLSFVNTNGVFNHTNLPVGDYKFELTDNCGVTYTVTANVPAFVFGNLVAITRPDCNPTSGAVMLSTTNGALVSMQITSAPNSFNFPVPYEVNANINSGGVFYMSDLPAGMYTFQGTDACGFNLQITVEVFGYTRDSAGFELNRKCGSFDIILDNNDETITGKKFWLQRFFPATNSWGHPYTGAIFEEGTIPTATTGLQLSNNQTLLNIFLLGDFRVIKVFDSFDNGNPNATCSDLYVEFTIARELVILGAYNLSCDDGISPNDIVIGVTGVAPFNYKMTLPTIIDNGESNTFYDLEEGTYNFQVSDDCGNIKNIPVVVGNLLPLAVANQPQSMLVCRTDGVQFGAFPLINQTPQILGNQLPNAYNVTYHLTQADADNDVNPLPDGYTNISNPQTIYVRVEHKIITLCYATTSFIIFAGVTPILSPEKESFICEGFTKVLTADAGFPSYLWSTGETTQSITVNTSGTYTVTVSNVYQDFSCDASKNFVVTDSNRPTIQSIDTSDWTSDQNTVVVLATGSGNYLYSLDNINFQTDNTFTNLTAGTYTVYVKDDNGCGTADGKFVLLNYPKYFTPNGDGYNDTWHIRFSSFEPNLNVTVYDRYSRLIVILKAGQEGWDGTYNGQLLPATDYWFVTTREDGTVYKGHFSLKR